MTKPELKLKMFIRIEHIRLCLSFFCFSLCVVRLLVGYMCNMLGCPVFFTSPVILYFHFFLFGKKTFKGLVHFLKYNTSHIYINIPDFPAYGVYVS